MKATITEIGRVGSLDVTVSQIAKRAGMSPALAHHYFGGKEQIFLAAMRYTMGVYAAEVRGALSMSEGARGRIVAIIRASFSERNFRRDTIAAWMNFYVLAQMSSEAKRLLTIYQRRLRSNLVHGLRPLIGAQSEGAAERMAALIDGVYLRESLGRDVPERQAAVMHLLELFDMELQRGAR